MRRRKEREEPEFITHAKNGHIKYSTMNQHECFSKTISHPPPSSISIISCKHRSTKRWPLSYLQAPPTSEITHLNIIQHLQTCSTSEAEDEVVDRVEQRRKKKGFDSFPYSCERRLLDMGTSRWDHNSFKCRLDWQSPRPLCFRLTSKDNRQIYFKVL